MQLSTSTDFPGYNREEYLTDFQDGVKGFISTSDKSGKLRLVRLGSILTGYYYNSSSGNWVSIYSGSVTTADVNVSLASWSHDYAFMDKEGKVAFDNFLVNQCQLIGLISIPTATTDSATNVKPNSANLNGKVNASSNTFTHTNGSSNTNSVT